MEAHEWMIKYTNQTEWIERRGLFLWLAFYTGGLGGGLYIVSLFFNCLEGMIISWLIIALLKGGLHFAFLGKPWRFWRIVIRPKTSWLSRGLIFVITFVILAGIQIMFSILAPHTAVELIFKILAGIAALGVTIYTGFVLNSIKSVPFWNSLLLPILFFSCGILGGFGLIFLIALLGARIDIESAELGSRILLFINTILIAVYLWKAAQKGTTGRQSVLEQMRGNTAAVFWAGVVTMGIVIPTMVVFGTQSINNHFSIVLFIGIICEIIGGLTLRYCILRVGIYQPLFTLPSYSEHQLVNNNKF